MAADITEEVLRRTVTRIEEKIAAFPKGDNRAKPLYKLLRASREALDEYLEEKNGK